MSKFARPPPPPKRGLFVFIFLIKGWIFFIQVKATSFSQEDDDELDNHDSYVSPEDIIYFVKVSFSLKKYKGCVKMSENALPSGATSIRLPGDRPATPSRRPAAGKTDPLVEGGIKPVWRGREKQARSVGGDPVQPGHHQRGPPPLHPERLQPGPDLVRRCRQYAHEHM